MAPSPGLYVDANAVSPGTAAAIRAVVEGVGARYVDGAIIGGPPEATGSSTRLYLSGADAPAVAEVFAGGGLETLVLDGEATAASALKMAYAGWTKGTAALLLTMREAARAHGVEDALVREWEHSIPSLPARSAQAARAADEKGWRWVAEMREIAATLAGADLPAGFHEAAAQVFERRHQGSNVGPTPCGGRKPTLGARAAPDGAFESLVATIRRRPWPARPRSSPSPNARSRTRAPRAACAAQGQVPGVLYGGDDDAVAFVVDERELRHALAAQGAVVELQLGSSGTPAVLQDAQRHPVRGHTMHVDFLRVNLNVAIHAVVTLELLGGEDAPGTKEGGVLEHVTREINIEALPNDIPERLELDVSKMDVNDTLFLSAVTAPAGVTILDDPDETVVATLTPPKLQAELDALDEEAALEQETQVVGEGEAPKAEEGEDAGGDDAAGESSE